MLQASWSRWMLVALVSVSLVALLAWARNDPGVDDRDPDPPQGTQVVTVDDTTPPLDTPVITAADTVPPTT